MPLLISTKHDIIVTCFNNEDLRIIRSPVQVTGAIQENELADDDYYIVAGDRKCVSQISGVQSIAELVNNDAIVLFVSCRHDRFGVRKRSLRWLSCSEDYFRQDVFNEAIPAVGEKYLLQATDISTVKTGLVSIEVIRPESEGFSPSDVAFYRNPPLYDICSRPYTTTSLDVVPVNNGKNRIQIVYLEGNDGDIENIFTEHFKTAYNTECLDISPVSGFKVGYIPYSERQLKTSQLLQLTKGCFEELSKQANLPLGFADISVIDVFNGEIVAREIIGGDIDIDDGKKTAPQTSTE